MNKKVKLSDLSNIVDHCIMKREPDLVTFSGFHIELSQFQSSHHGFFDL